METLKLNKKDRNVLKIFKANILANIEKVDLDFEIGYCEKRKVESCFPQFYDESFAYWHTCSEWLRRLKSKQAIRKNEKSCELLYTKKEVKLILKRQIKQIRNSVGRMKHNAPDEDILNKISKSRLVKF